LTQIIHSNDEITFLDEKIVYESFYGAPLTCSYFFFEEKFCVLACVGKSLARMFIVWSISKTLSREWYLQLYLTHTVHSNNKMFFPQQRNCLLKFLWCAAHILLFVIFFKEKLCVSVHISKSRACLNWFTLCRKKSYLSVVFAPWRWDCWSVYISLVLLWFGYIWAAL